ncbi:hypothetical protein HB917_10865 [Listeria seeligeri]|uniref:AIPR family protein n=1 Tax=Listeria seeligeri TaxID=1640 RepID=UPI0016268CAC|nr:AIPR family protein [Listeria seeligeri]MBC1585699.1 hypothetical protein [Listeria seeligeri]MBC1599765.1 hypothetical protein [Listeria seeligeri]
MIVEEIERIQRFGEDKGAEITKDKAFNILVLQYYCYKEKNLDMVWNDILQLNITDGKNDGGIDFVYFDDEDSKVIIGQNKCSELVELNDCIAEISKVVDTIKNFERGKTGSYNKKVKDFLQNALDRLTDESFGNVEIIFSSLAGFNKNKVFEKLEMAQKEVSEIEIQNNDDLIELIAKVRSQDETVKESSFELDKSKNYLEYESGGIEGAFVNISSKSLTQAYNKFHSKGLFNLNIRRFIKSKNVDDGILDTLESNRDSFWFLNNGLTIACEDYYIDGNKVKLYGYSIVNGGQTTTLISEFKGKNTNEFFIPCKLLKRSESSGQEDLMNFFSKIAEATNSQKPIQPKDLKANAPEMRELKEVLKNEKVDLEIKRGESINNKKYKIKIKNDELAQLIFSFVNQKPGTARSNKKALFVNNKFYSLIFKQGYASNKDKKAFLLDLIELNERFSYLSKRFKSNLESSFNMEEANIFNNARTIIFALFGVVYRLVNKDISITDLKQDSLILENKPFQYGAFISNYHEDDIAEKIESLVREFIEILLDEYEQQFEAGKVTSVSNFFKTDKKYMEAVIGRFSRILGKKKKEEEIISNYGSIFRR